MLKKKNALVYKSLDPLDSSVQHVKEYIGTKKPLCYEEQLWIFRKDPAKRTDTDALKLIDSNLAMVFKVTSDLHKRHKQMSNNFKNACDVSFIDLFQAGVIGLNRAVVKFDSKREMKFSTYAYYWIKAYIKNEIRNLIYPMKTQTYAKVGFVRSDSPRNEEIEVEDKFFNHINYNDIISEAKTALTPFDFTIFNMYFVDEIPVKLISPRVKRCDITVRDHIKKIQCTLQEIFV